jgi:hypothetical protein
VHGIINSTADNFFPPAQKAHSPNTGAPSLNAKHSAKLKTSRAAALLYFWLLLNLSSSAFALEKSDDIDTNRPSFCQSALVVPAGSLQLENGTLYQHFQHGLTYFDVPENQVRLGLTKKTEFQMFTPNMILYNQSRSTVVNTTALNEAGLKHQFGPYKRLTASVVVAANIPTGSKLLSGTAVVPVFRLPYAVQLSKNWTFCGMQSLLVTQPHGNIEWQPFVMVSRALGPKACAFAEYAGFFQQNSHAPGQSIAHFGALYKLNRHHQIDIQYGFGLSKTAPAAFVGMGYSYRFDGLPRGNKAKKKAEPPQAPISPVAPPPPSASSTP